MAPVGQAMIIDTVNQSDVPVGRVPRAEVFQKHLNFRVSHVFIFNSSGELLLQRLALARERNPGAWGSSVASYLFAGEDYEQAARRRVIQELGIESFPLELLGKTEMMDDGCLKFISLFRSQSDGPFNPDRSQIEALEFIPVGLVHQTIDDGTRTFTPTFLKVFELFRSLAV